MLSDSSAPAFQGQMSSASSSGLRGVGVHEVIVKPIGAPRKCADGSRMRVQYVNRFSIARSALGWSQDKAALKLGCSRRWVIEFEHGRVALTEEAMTFTSWLEEQALERTGT